jgi:hypothetical protein
MDMRFGTWSVRVAVNSSFVGTPEKRRPPGRPRRRCEDNIRMDLRKIVWESVDCIQLAEDTDQWRAVVNMVMNLRVQ